MRINGPFHIAICLLLASFSSFAQQSATSNGISAAIPKVRFVFDHGAMEVSHYEIEVDADGHAAYKSTGKPDAQSGEVDTLNKEFNLSPATRSRIFELARQADYFNGSFDFTKNKVAFTGKKT